MNSWDDATSLSDIEIDECAEIMCDLSHACTTEQSIQKIGPSYRLWPKQIRRAPIAQPITYNLYQGDQLMDADLCVWF